MSFLGIGVVLEMELRNTREEVTVPEETRLPIAVTARLLAVVDVGE